MNHLRSVLFIEDNPGDVRLVREYLRDSLGDACELREAATLGDGLSDLRSQPVDLVLLDLGLSDSSGLDTLLRVQSEVPWTPVVVFTGSDDAEVASAAMRIGAEDVLQKGDANSIQLVRSMQHAVSRHARSRQQREAAWQHQTLAAHAREGLLVLDDKGLVVRANVRAATLLGRPAGMQGRLVGQRVADLVHAGHADRLANLLDSQAPAVQTQQLLLQAAGGHSQWVQATANRVPGPGSWRGRWVLVLTDLGPRPPAADAAHPPDTSAADLLAERTEALRLQALAQERFQHALAHDLRTPLNGILGYAAVLRQELREVMTPPQVRKFKVIEHSARLMAGLVSSLLQQASAQADAQPLAMEAVDLSAAAEVVAAALEAADPGRVVQWQIQPGLWAVGDPGLLASLVANLLQNAWKYSSAAESARISLRADAEPGQPTVYRVRDNGMGFTAEESATLFQRFHRLPSAQGMPGLGIGLATVQHIITRHGGRIWAEGAPGQGACFSFTLGSDASAVSSIP
jgi:signal transduction histidine kinase